MPPGAAADEEAYLRAAATFGAWRDEGVLVRDELPGIVVVDQTYTGPDGLERTRRGFVARLRLADLDERVVLPHERTHAGPKVDRLRLYRATHADVSQIFLLFPDDDGAAGAKLDAAAAELPAAAWREAHDGDGNRHVAAALAGPAAETRRRGAPRPARLHRRRPPPLRDRPRLPRRATRRRRLQRRHADGLPLQPERPRAHRVPHAPSAARHRSRSRSTTWCEHLRPFFDVVGEPVTGAEACRAALEALPEQADPARVFGLYLPREETCITVKTREPAATERLTAGGFSAAAAGLSVTMLHELLFREALGLEHEDAERFVDYAKSVPDALAALQAGDYELGAFLNATLVDQVRAIADQGEVMPQKSTYFYPKLLTGPRVRRARRLTPAPARGSAAGRDRNDEGPAGRSSAPPALSAGAAVGRRVVSPRTAASLRSRRPPERPRRPRAPAAPRRSRRAPRPAPSGRRRSS